MVMKIAEYEALLKGQSQQQPQPMTSPDPSAWNRGTSGNPNLRLDSVDQQGYHYTSRDLPTSFDAIATPASPYKYAEIEGRGFWENPQRIARYYHFLRAAPPDWKAPDWLNPEAVDQAYQYMQFKNKGADWWDWKWLNDKDPGSGWLRSLQTPPPEYLLPDEQKFIKTQEQVNQQKPIDYRDLPKWQQWALTLTAAPAASPGIANRPKGEQFLSAAATAAPGALGGFALGATAGSFIAPGVGTLLGGAIGAAAFEGAGIYAGMTGQQLPGFKQIGAITNVLAVGAERTIGTIWQIGEGASKEEAGVKGALSDVLDNLPDAWYAANATYANLPGDPINTFLGAAKGLESLGVDMETKGSRFANPDEVWKISQGLTTPQKTKYGGVGIQALEQIRDELDARHKAGENYGMAAAEIMTEFGDSGTVKQMIGQTVLDPANAFPFVSSAAVAKWAGKMSEQAYAKGLNAEGMGYRRLQTYMEMGKGNILVDFLPPIIQNIFEGITGIRGSKGAIASFTQYKNAVKAGIWLPNVIGMPADMEAKYHELISAGVKPRDISVDGATVRWKDAAGTEQTYKASRPAQGTIPEVEQLADFEKKIAGIDDQYGITEFKPTKDMNWFQKLWKLDPASQAMAMINNFHASMSTLLNMADGDVGTMAKLFRQAAGIDPTKAGDMGEAILKSPAMRSLRDAIGYGIAKDGLLNNLMADWEVGKNGRNMLRKLSTATGMTAGEIVEMAKTRPDNLVNLLKKTAAELPAELGSQDKIAAVQQLLKPFIAEENPTPWSEQQMQAQMMVAISKAMDDWYKDFLGVKPDHAVFRLSNMMKGVQSLLLLGLNPAYFVNNTLNNITTRAAVGVFGFMTPKQIGDFYQRFEIIPPRLQEGIGAIGDPSADTYSTHAQVADMKAAKDWIDSATRRVQKINGALGIFSKLSGKVERMESQQAYTIGIKQFWGRNWKRRAGFSGMHPVLEAMLDKQAPGMKEWLYQAAESGMNMREITEAIMGETIKPMIRGIAGEVAGAMAPHSKEAVEDLLNKSGILDELERELEGATNQDDIDLAFDKVDERLRQHIESRLYKEIQGVAEEARNKVGKERVPAILQIHGEIEIRRGDHWINSRRQWDELYSRREDLQAAGKWNDEVVKLQKKQREDWDRLYAMEIETIRGTVEALGIKDKNAIAYIDAMSKANDNWRKFYQATERLYKTYFDAMKKNSKKPYTERAKLRTIAWDTLQDDLDRLYDKHFSQEGTIQGRMDGLFSKMYAETGWDRNKAAGWRQAVWSKRYEIYEAQKAQRAATRGMDSDARDAAYADFNVLYNRKIAEMHELEHNGAWELFNETGRSETIPVPPARQPDMPPAPEDSGEPAPARTPKLQKMWDRAKAAGITGRDGEVVGKYLLNVVNKYLADDGRQPITAEQWESLPFGDFDAAIQRHLLKHANEQAAEKIVAKLQYQDIVREANDLARERAIHEAGGITRRNFEDQLRSVFPSATDTEIRIHMLLVDSYADAYAKRQGYPPTQATRDAYYATRMQKEAVRRRTGGGGKGLPAQPQETTLGQAVDVMREDDRNWHYTKALRFVEANPQKRYRADQLWNEVLKPVREKGGAQRVDEYGQPVFVKENTGILAAAGIKQEEMEWLGIREFLEGKDTVTREELIDHIRSHQLEMDEYTYGYKPLTDEMVDIEINRLRTNVTELYDNQRVELAEKLFPREYWEDLMEDLIMRRGDEDGDFETVRERGNFEEPSYAVEEMLGSDDDYPFKVVDENTGEVYDEFKTREEAQKAADDVNDTIMKVFAEAVREYTLSHNWGDEDKLRAAAIDSWANEDPAGIEKIEERLTTLPTTEAINYLRDIAIENLVSNHRPTQYGSYRYLPDTGKNYREVLIKVNLPGASFTRSHWGGSSGGNTLVHVRMDDRMDVQGRKVLFVQEVQSDWHEKGRQHGYVKRDLTPKIYPDFIPDVEDFQDTPERLAFIDKVMPEEYSSTAYDKLMKKSKLASEEWDKLTSMDSLTDDERARMEEVYKEFRTYDDKAEHISLIRVNLKNLLAYNQMSRSPGAWDKWVFSDDTFTRIIQEDIKPEEIRLKMLKYPTTQNFGVSHVANIYLGDRINKIPVRYRADSVMPYRIQINESIFSADTPEQLRQLVVDIYTKLIKPITVVDHNGNKIAFTSTDEMKRQGVIKERQSTSGIPDAPWKRTEDWVMLAMKNVIDKAVKEGYDRVAWTRPFHHVDLYSSEIRKRVDRLQLKPAVSRRLVQTTEWIMPDGGAARIVPDDVNPGHFLIHVQETANGYYMYKDDGSILEFRSENAAKRYLNKRKREETGWIKRELSVAKDMPATDKGTLIGYRDGGEVINREVSLKPEDEENLAAIVGRSIADKLIAGEEVSGDNLTVGGEIYNLIYDKIMSKQDLPKYIKKWGATIDESNIDPPMRYRLEGDDAFSGFESKDFPTREAAEKYAEQMTPRIIREIKRSGDVDPDMDFSDYNWKDWAVITELDDETTYQSYYTIVPRDPEGTPDIPGRFSTIAEAEAAAQRQIDAFNEDMEDEYKISIVDTYRIERHERQAAGTYRFIVTDKETGSKMYYPTEQEAIRSLGLAEKVINKSRETIGEPPISWQDRYELTETQGKKPDSVVDGFDLTPAMRESVTREGQPLMQGRKGEIEFDDYGRAVITAFEGADISTVVHEIGHIFRRDLEVADLEVVARVGGLRDAAELQDLEGKFMRQEIRQGDEDYDRYVQAEEYFARAWERYLTEGDLPDITHVDFTTGMKTRLKTLLKRFTDWMLSIYKTLTKEGGKIKHFDTTPAFQVGGRTVNVQATANGIPLKDIFDRMLTDSPSRPKDYMDLIADEYDAVRATAGGSRNSKDESYRIARRNTIRKVLQPFQSEAEATKAADEMEDYLTLADGTEADEGSIYQALEDIRKNPELNPWVNKEVKILEGVKTYVSGIQDVSRRYNLRHVVMELEDIIPSDKVVGNKIIPNGDYDQTKQGRDRGTGASFEQINTNARNLVPEQILRDFGTSANGTPIIDKERMVLSGNGRTLYLQKALQDYPQKWEEYRAAIDEWAPQYGIDPEDYQDMQHPVLVRMIDDTLDPVEIREFSRDANTPAAAEMSAEEMAVDAAKNMNPENLLDLQIGDEKETVKGMIDRNRFLRDTFLAQIPKNKQVQYMRDGRLTELGYKQISLTMFMSVFEGEAAKNLIDKFARTEDTNTKTIEKALYKSLPALARVEIAARTGRINPDLSIANDIARAADLVVHYRTDGKDYFDSFDQYVTQEMSALIDPITERQADIANLFYASKAQAPIINWINKYLELAGKEPNNIQPDIFNPTAKARGKDELIDETNRATAEQIRADAAAAEELAGSGSRPGDQAAPGAGEELVQDEGNRPEQRPGQQVRSQEAAREFLAGAPVKIDNLYMATISHQETMPVPQEIQQILAGAGRTGKKKAAAIEYARWIYDGERGEPALENPAMLKKIAGEFYEDGYTAQLRDAAADRSRAVRIATDPIPTAGTYAVKTYAFKHGDHDIIGAVYKDGKLIAYLPDVENQQQSWDVNDRKVVPIGVDPHNPDVWVYDDAGETGYHNAKNPSLGQDEIPPLPKDVVENMIRSALKNPGAEEFLRSMVATADSFTHQIQFMDEIARHDIAMARRISDKVRNSNSFLTDDARYRRNSLGQETVTETPAFRNWFAGSKVIDDQGQPLVVYHGTKSAFEEFLPSATFKFEGGYYFTSDPVKAGNYAMDVTNGRQGSQPNVMPVYLTIKNPLRWTPLKSDEVTVAKAQAAGYDGIFVMRGSDVVEYVAFDPQQIKSIHNVGTFNPESRNILMQADQLDIFEDILPRPKPVRPDPMDELPLFSGIPEEVQPEGYNPGNAQLSFFDQADIKARPKKMVEVAIRTEAGTEYKRVPITELGTIRRLQEENPGVVMPYRILNDNNRVIKSGKDVTEVIAPQFGNTLGQPTMPPQPGRPLEIASQPGRPTPQQPGRMPEATPGALPDDNPIGEVPLNGTPVVEPAGTPLKELYDQADPIMRKMRQTYKERSGTRQFKMGDLDPKSRKEVEKWLAQVRNDMGSMKLASMKYGETLRDAALLDYNRRYGFDNFLGMASPYQFWNTRSIINWSKRMIDKPSWFAMWARISAAQERNRKNLPTRLKGKMRIPAPWLPEWAGSGIFFDPIKTFFPPATFAQPFEQLAMTQNQINKRAEQILTDMAERGEITADARQKAIDTRAGKDWTLAVRTAEDELDKDGNPINLASMMLQPPMWYSVAANIASGTPEKISTLPMTRTGQTIRELGKGTFAEPATNLAGAILAAPEENIRKAAGLSEFGEWGDYLIDREIANMVGNGERTAEEGQAAMIERAGEIYDEAVSRVKYQRAIGTPGAQGIMAVKEGATLPQVAAATITGLFPGGLFPQGELELRGLAAEYSNAWNKYRAGHEEAITDFFDENPEYKARLALFAEPEERMRQFLISQIWDKYTSLEKPNQSKAIQWLGQEFEEAFINKTTRHTDDLPIETLATWAQDLGALVPKTQETANLPAPNPPAYYDQATVEAVKAYKAERDQKFPNISGIQSTYYSLQPGAERKAFLQQFPQLPSYWDWNKAYKASHPEMQPYLDDQAARYDVEKAQNEMTDPLVRQLMDLALGRKLSGGAAAEMRRIWKMSGSDLTYEEFEQLILRTLFR